MVRISIETLQEKTNHVSEIVEKTYEIPDSIICPVCGKIVEFSKYHRSYICDCGYDKTAELYIKEELGI